MASAALQSLVEAAPAMRATHLRELLKDEKRLPLGLVGFRVVVGFRV